jgi:5-methyltetrahydropteroyltriglutamate--homocysteine methyltransferase
VRDFAHASNAERVAALLRQSHLNVLYYTAMPRTIPPFRADMVGSLLRPAPLRHARERRANGEITTEELRVIEDREIATIIARQAEIGLALATDGELRRSRWQYDFFWHLTGVERVVRDQGSSFRGVQSRPEGAFVSGKLDFPADHPMLGHFKFLAAHTEATPKMTLPSPLVLHFRRGRAGISRDAYPDIDGYFDDLARCYRKAVRAFYAAGCRYLQLDDTVWAHLGSQREIVLARERGEDVGALPGRYAQLLNRVLADKPADMVITTHSCHGNFRSSWQSEGSYEAIAELLLGGVDYDGYFLEYDSARAGGFEPLRFLPRGKKMVVLGLVTTKTGMLERKDDIKRRLDAAAKVAPLDQLCLSPQCGFASTEEGNTLTEDEQWAKLRMIVELTDEIWG